MKPTVPELGTVIRLDQGRAVVLLQGGDACKGCGAGKLGLCKPSGGISTLTVLNGAGAAVGDSVRIGVAGKTQTAGFLLAFIIPFLSLIAGAAVGYWIGQELGIPSLEVVTGFATFLAVSWLTFRRLRTLDSQPSMVIEEIVRDSEFSTEVRTEEEKRFEGYATKP